MANPYQAPQDLSPIAPSLPAIGSAEEIRRAHIKHEASIKSIGVIYYLIGFITCASLITLLAATSGAQGMGGAEVAMTSSLACIGVFLFIVAYHLRRLKPWARIAGTILSTIGLLGFPIGTLINVYFLSLLLSKKGAMIFSPEYKEIIAATPQVKYKTSAAAWILLAIVILGFIAIVIALRA